MKEESNTRAVPKSTINQKFWHKIEIAYGFNIIKGGSRDPIISTLIN